MYYLQGVVTNYGEGAALKWEGGQVMFYPYKKGGVADKVLAMLKVEGHNKFWGSFNTGAWSFSHTDWGDAKSFHPVKSGNAESFTLSCGGGAQQVLDPQFSHFVAPPL